MMTNLIAGTVLMLYLLAAWFVASLMGLAGARLWVLRGALVLIGIVAASTFLWFRKRLAQDARMRG